MKIECIAGFATITKEPAASAALYRDILGLPLESRDDYSFSDHVAGAKHFGVWPLKQAAQSCFGKDDWPKDVPVPQATVKRVSATDPIQREVSNRRMASA